MGYKEQMADVERAIAEHDAAYARLAREQEERRAPFVEDIAVITDALQTFAAQMAGHPSVRVVRLSTEDNGVSTEIALLLRLHTDLSEAQAEALSFVRDNRHESLTNEDRLRRVRRALASIKVSLGSIEKQRHTLVELGWPDDTP